MNSDGPSLFRLTAFHQFKASHSLEGFRIPHFHLWKVEIQFEKSVPLMGDRVVDLILAEAKLSEIMAPLHGSFLDQALGVSPTSENLCVWIWERMARVLPDAPISSVTVSLCDLEGNPSGRVELRR